MFYEDIVFSFQSLKIHCFMSIKYLNENYQLVILTILAVLVLKMCRIFIDLQSCIWMILRHLHIFHKISSINKFLFARRRSAAATSLSYRKNRKIRLSIVERTRKSFRGKETFANSWKGPIVLWENISKFRRGGTDKERRSARRERPRG